MFAEMLTLFPERLRISQKTRRWPFTCHAFLWQNLRSSSNKHTTTGETKQGNFHAIKRDESLENARF